MARLEEMLDNQAHEPQPQIYSVKAVKVPEAPMVLISLVRANQLAQNAVGPMLPYLGFQVLKLGVGQNLNQHRDYHNHPDYPNHTMKFGKYRGGSLQMLRDGLWHSYDTEDQWLSFDALKVVHQVTPVISGERYSITLYTPGKLDRLTAQDWDILAKAGFRISHLSVPARMRRLTTPSHVMSLTLESERARHTLEHGKADEPHYYHRSSTAIADHLAKNDDSQLARRPLTRPKKWA